MIAHTDQSEDPVHASSMSSGLDDVELADDAVRRFDSRYGWLFAMPWLFFVLAPVVFTYQADADPKLKAVTYLAIAGFVTVYTVAYKYSHFLSERYGLRGHIVAMVVCSLLGAVTASAVGPISLTFVPFVGALAASFLPYRYAAVVLLAAWVVVVVVWWWVRDLWVLGFIVWIAMATLPVALGRFVDENSERENQILRRALVAEDRDRIARDMHDILGHTLTVVTVKTELAEKLIERDPDRARQEMHEVQALTRQALADVRTTVSGLRLTRLDDELVSARQVFDAAGISFVMDGDLAEVNPQYRITLAWVLREAVTNVVRHAEATSVTISWGSTWCEVRDDGRGISGRREGNGLTGLRERIEGLGGTMTISSGTSHNGTCLRIDLP